MASAAAVDVAEPDPDAPCSDIDAVGKKVAASGAEA
jgi:hypothetical protein